MAQTNLCGTRGKVLERPPYSVIFLSLLYFLGYFHDRIKEKETENEKEKEKWIGSGVQAPNPTTPRRRVSLRNFPH
jgi:hypothetical protein